MKGLVLVLACVMLAGTGVVFGQPPCNATTYINPALYSSQCVVVCPGSVLQIHVYGPLGPHDVPVFMMLPGCDPRPGTLCEYECPFPPGPIFWTYDETAWTYNGDASWDNFIYGTGEGCLCVTFAGILDAELLSFEAVAGNNRVTLNWTTASETNNAAFEIMRDDVKVAEIASQGNSATGHHYSWTDETVLNDITFYYKLVARDIEGNREEIATASATPRAGAGVVTEYALRNNYPNPFNPTTTISFDLVEAGFTSLKVYNIQGQEVSTLVNGNMTSGSHSVLFDAAGLPSGMYLYRLNVNGYSAEQKMLLLK
jgi:hypothetical protein